MSDRVGIHPDVCNGRPDAVRDVGQEVIVRRARILGLEASAPLVTTK